MITLTFHGDLASLIRGAHVEGKVEYRLTRRASLKDIIESLGLVHTEVWQCVLAGKEVELKSIPESGAQIEVYPHSMAPIRERKLWVSQHLAGKLLFLADSTVLKLARMLRMLGFDVRSERDLIAERLIALSVDETRILLSRNRELLKRKAVVHGQLIRAEQPIVQVGEVLGRFPSSDEIVPFKRCMECNGLLEQVAKEEIVHRLLPLTRKYYHSFYRCSSCDRLYWKGSHYDRMTSIVQQLHKEHLE